MQPCCSYFRITAVGEVLFGGIQATIAAGLYLCPAAMVAWKSLPEKDQNFTSGAFWAPSSASK